MRHWGKKGFDDLSLDVHKYLRVNKPWQGRGRTSNSYAENNPLDNNANTWKERWQQRSSIFCTLKTIKNKIGQKNEW